MKEAIDSQKGLSRTRNSWRIFSVDRLSQMTPILDNSLLSKKRKLSGMIKWGRMNVYILLENIVNQMLFPFLFELLCFTRCLWHPHQMCSKSNFWLNGLGKSKLRSAGRLSKQTNGLHPHSGESWISKDAFVRGWGTKISTLSISFNIVTMV